MIQVLNDIQLTKNFKLSEFQCPDGSESVKLEMRGVTMLQALREALGVPVTIASGYRTDAYNARIGGAPDSYHKRGMAWDVKTRLHPLDVAKAAERVGFMGIGIYTHNGQRFVHLDIRASKRYWKDQTGGALIRVNSLNEIKK